MLRLSQYSEGRPTAHCSLIPETAFHAVQRLSLIHISIYTQAENPNLEYVIPKEGSNLWIDSWVIPKNAQHKENAEKFINFLCRPDIAKMNFDYITYSTPNTGARELIEDPAIRNSKIAFPEPEDLVNCETLDVYKRQPTLIIPNRAAA